VSYSWSQNGKLRAIHTRERVRPLSVVEGLRVLGVNVAHESSKNEVELYIKNTTPNYNLNLIPTHN
jgi:hypothetical protein